MMQNLRFPLNFTFKIFTPSNDFTVFDAQGEEVAYTRQKIFKIKESIEIFRNGSRNETLYTIDADCFSIFIWIFIVLAILILMGEIL